MSCIPSKAYTQGFGEFISFCEISVCFFSEIEGMPLHCILGTTFYPKYKSYSHIPSS